MTPSDSSQTRTSRQLLVLTLLALGIAAYGVAPKTLPLDASGTELWYVIGWIAAPFLAGVAALRTAARCDGSARKAWHGFGLASFLWMAGTIAWASYGWTGVPLPFPSPADAFYVLTAAAFMHGMYHYSLAGSGGSRIQVTNFALAITAVVATGFILFFPALLRSRIEWFGTVIAFTYPVLWLATFAFGLLCYCLYVPDRRRFPFLLILTAAGAHAGANFLYAFDVLNQTYTAGTYYHVLWVAAYAFVASAALQHRPHKGACLRPADHATVRPGEALVPALSVAAVLAAGVATEVQHLGPYVLMILPVMFGFAGLLAIREHSLFTTERKLRKQAEASSRLLAESEARLSHVLANTTDGVMVLDTQWRITFANPKAVDMLFADRPYLGIQLWDLRKADQTRVFYKNYATAMRQQTPVEFEAYLASLDLWLEVHAYPTPETLTVFFRDVTERRRSREELVRLARHDPLTSLANRMLFTERLTQGLQSDRRHCDLILVLIDLDNFKQINDSRGHVAGDSLLQQFADRLTSVVRHGDTVARFGGDEFAIIQPGPSEPEGGAEVARRISEILLEPFNVHGSRVTLSVSIGIAVAPKHGTRPEELVFNADLALYRAKEAKGTGMNHCIFEPGVDDHLQSRQPPPQRPRASSGLETA